MKDFIKRIFKKKDNYDSKVANIQVNDISDTTSVIFEKYKKSFKDLARYDREGKIETN